MAAALFTHTSHIMGVRQRCGRGLVAHGDRDFRPQEWVMALPQAGARSLASGARATRDIFAVARAGTDCAVEQMGEIG